jgi:hypothetical protein
MAKHRGSGDGSIYKAPSGRWVAVITISSGGGKQTRRKRTARTFNEARTRLRELQHDRDAGLIVTRQSLAAYMAEWKANILPTRDVTVATIENYATMIDRHIVPALGHIRLDLLQGRPHRPPVQADGKRGQGKIDHTIGSNSVRHSPKTRRAASPGCAERSLFQRHSCRCSYPNVAFADS